MMRTTAAVTAERGAPFVIEDVDLDEPAPGEVRVALVASGVCHTDAVARDGDLPFPVPGVLGHEGVGHVDAVGEGVTTVAVGEPVLLGWPWCGRCRNCLAGQPRYCRDPSPPTRPVVSAAGRASALARRGAVRTPRSPRPARRR